ncbi:MAG: 16S rRNA (guanine(527)-N(7))-methyltransferase RsmG [Chloroflexota bacterium]
MSRNPNYYNDRSDEHSSNPLQTLQNGVQFLGITLSPRQIGQFQRYQHELIRWNTRVNLTSILEPEEIERRHFLDSLSCISGAEDQLREPANRMIDIGSGAGFPGIPIKIALPALKLTLVETRAKRAAFLEHLISAIELEDTLVAQTRAETLGHDPSHREQYDVALTRALGSMALTAELCLPFLKLGGRLVAPRRGDSTTDIQLAEPIFLLLGANVPTWLPVHITGIDDGRQLMVATKQSPTSAQYPRRPGLPGKRPIGH